VAIRLLLVALLALPLAGCGIETTSQITLPAGVHGNLVVLDDTNFDQYVTSGEGVVMVDFWATWCGPCIEMGSIVEQLADEYAGRAVVCKLDVDRATSVARQHRISGIPAFVFFRDGVEVERVIGSQPKHEMTATLDRLLAGSQPK